MKGKKSSKKKFGIAIGILILILSIPSTSAVKTAIFDQKLEQDTINPIDILKQKLLFSWPFPIITLIYKIIEYINSIPFHSP